MIDQLLYPLTKLSNIPNPMIATNIRPIPYDNNEIEIKQTQTHSNYHRYTNSLNADVRMTTVPRERKKERKKGGMQKNTAKGHIVYYHLSLDFI
jgi:hypothetical protein